MEQFKIRVEVWIDEFNEAAMVSEGTSRIVPLAFGSLIHVITDSIDSRIYQMLEYPLNLLEEVDQI